MKVTCAFCDTLTTVDDQGKCPKCNANVFAIPLKDSSISSGPWLELSQSIADTLSSVARRYGEALSDPMVLCKEIMIRTTYIEQSKTLYIFLKTAPRTVKDALWLSKDRV